MAHSPKKLSLLNYWSDKTECSYESHQQDPEHSSDNTIKNKKKTLPLNSSTYVSHNDEDEFSVSSSSSEDHHDHHINFEDHSENCSFSSKSSESIKTGDQDNSNEDNTSHSFLRYESCQSYEILFRQSIIKTIKEQSNSSTDYEDNIIARKSNPKTKISKNFITNSSRHSKKIEIDNEQKAGAFDNKIKLRKNNHRYEKLVKRSRARRKIKGFDAPTILAEAKKVKKTPKEETILTLEEKNQQENEKLKYITEQRRKHKQKLKQMLRRLAKSKQIMDRTEAIEAEEKEKRRRRITKKVLDKIKRSKHKNTYSDSGSSVKNKYTLPSLNLKPKKHIVSQSANKLAYDGMDIIDTTENEAGNIQDLKEKKKILNELKKKSIAHIAEIQKKRHEKEIATENERKRQLKQKLILRNRYLKNEINDEQQKDDTSEDGDPDANPREEISSLKSTKVLSQEDVEFLAQRLTKRKDDRLSLPPEGIMDFSKWKRKNNVKSEQKVFCLTGWYPSVKDDLIERGWFFNPESESMFFDLKWSLSSNEILFDSLQPSQRVNHFQNSGPLTTKAGLIRTLRNLSFFTDSDHRDIFPLSYDLTSFGEVKEFINEFQFNKIETILRKMIMNEKITIPTNGNIDELSAINVGVFEILVNVLKKRCQNIDEDISLDVFSSYPCLISEEESEIINNADKWLYQKVFIDADNLPSTIISMFEIEAMSRNIVGNKPSRSRSKTQNEIKKDEAQKRRILKNRAKLTKSLTLMRNLTSDDLKQVHDILSNLHHFNKNEYQRSINGSPSNNLWIVKPASKSRGRGIKVFKDLDKILKYIHVSDMNKSASPSSYSFQWTIQKYIENPLTIAQRKFDIRQWVLVTSWSPLIVWLYDDCYIRFAVEKYDDNPENDNCNDANDESWTSEAYRHLVNNSISKHNPNFHKSFQAENGDEVLNHMWSLQSFQKWLIHQSNKDEIWESIILPQIETIIKNSTICAQEHIIHMEGSFELYGYDLMIDQNYHVWLIEVNSSPACDYSTEVTKSYVSRALPDIFKVVLDDHGRNSDTGGWTKLYQGKEVQTEGTLLCLNVDLTLAGKKIPTKKKRRVKQPKENDSVCNEINGTEIKNKTEYIKSSGVVKSHTLETIPINANIVKNNNDKQDTSENNKENYCPTIKPMDKSQEGVRDKKKMSKPKVIVPLRTIVLDM